MAEICWKKVDDGDYSCVSVAKLRQLRQEGISPRTNTFFNDKNLDLMIKLYQEDIRLYQERIGNSPLMKKHLTI